MTKLEIEAFLTIVKSGSISAAADHLFVTQPALSRRIAALEEELGYALFDRGRGVRTIKLTEQGTEFLRIAERLQRLYAEAEEIPKKKRRSILRVSTINSLAAYLMPPILKKMMHGEDACSVMFKSGLSTDIYGYVERGEVDIGLVSDPQHSRKVITFPIFREPFVFVGGENWKGTERVYPEMLDPSLQIRLPWNPEYDVWHEKWFAPDVTASMTADKMEFLEEYLEGEMWAVVPLLVAMRLKRNDIWLCPLERGPEDMTIYALTADSQKSGFVMQFLHEVHDEIVKIEGIQSFAE